MPDALDQFAKAFGAISEESAEWRARAEKAEAAVALQRGMVAGYKDRAEKAEAERDALAAALEHLGCITCGDAEVGGGLEGMLKAACEVVDAASPDQILAARDLEMRERGGRAALRCLGCTCPDSYGPDDKRHSRNCALSLAETWEPEP